MTSDRARATDPPFLPLPVALNAEGRPRRTGVEVEFAGLDESEVARVLSEVLGGEIEQSGPYRYSLCGSEIGDLTVELDTALRKNSDRRLVQEGLDLARGIIPVEVITAPIPASTLPRLDTAMSALRDAGAKGSGQGVFYGFGVHLNPEIAGLDHPLTPATIRAYGLIEEHLRAEDRIDGTRRLLPFVDRWPAALIDALAGAATASLRDLMVLYARHTTSRNHGLDLLPLFRHLDDRRFQRLFGGGDGGTTNARPTFHFRLPDSRIDEADWSLSQAWRDWLLVETVASDEALLDRLASARLRYRDRLLSGRGDWRNETTAILAEAGHRA